MEVESYRVDAPARNTARSTASNEVVAKLELAPR